MKNSIDREQAQPEDWGQNWNERCDLDLAFEALEDWQHFHTDTMRGRIRSLQLRPDEAWPYFEKAFQRVADFAPSGRNQLRIFYLKAYCFENALIEESVDTGDPRRTENYLRDLIQSRSPSDIASQLKVFCHAMFLLNKQDYRRAKSLCVRLIEESRDRMGDDKVGFYFTAAIACQGLGEESGSRDFLEKALFGIPFLEQSFNMGLYAGTAMALLRFWGRDAEAEEWENFLVHLKIPQKTADIFRERARRMFERSASLKRVFVF